MVRTKRVFSSHSQLAHVWAQQTQESGRASRMFFENSTDIFSYGHHYLAARIHTIKGKKFALVRSDAYSVSTSKHLSNIRSALRGLMPFFCVENVIDPKEAVKFLDNKAKKTITEALKRIKIESNRDKQWQLELIERAYGEASSLRQLLGLNHIYPKTKELTAVVDHLDKRLKRYKELNSPEMQAKRERERLKREERKEKLKNASLSEKIELFRKGKNVELPRLDFELLRVQGDRVHTSRGAVVPLQAARVLYKMIEAGKDVIGQRIGHFTINSVENARLYEGNSIPKEDKIITIGCHRILLGEARLVLGESNG